MAARSAPRPPFSTDLLADLHADNIPADQAARLWPEVRQDPEAVRFLHSLDGVRSELRALSMDDRIVHPIPDRVATRLDTLLDQLALGSAGSPPARPDQPHPTGTTSPPQAEPVSLASHRSKRLRWVAAAAATVAVLAGCLIAVTLVRGHHDRPAALPPAQDVGAGDMSVSQVLSVMGRHDVTGPLSTPEAVTRCAGAAVPNRSVLGAANATYRGAPAVLILLTGPTPPKITALLVGPGCSAADPQVREVRDIG
ncbi:MAG: hypothetical protein J2P18_01555 [Nocardia sp.]|nr:hypothetical protein [Nocardia sp.]